jgi:hypothetical protein
MLDARQNDASEPASSAPYQTAARNVPMLDLIMLAIGLGLFAATVGYAYACERL